MARLIVRADGPDDKNIRKRFITSGLEAGITEFILRDEDTDLACLGRMDAIFTSGGKLSDDYEEVIVKDPASQEYASSLAGKKKTVIVRADDWTVIPLENLIAAFSGSGTELLSYASAPEEAELMMSVLEKGTDGIIIETDDPGSIGGFGELLSKEPDTKLTEVTIRSVTPAGTGDRVCIDTCSMMVPGEGMLIGSYSNCLFLIQSESEDNGYVESRPFRVNAGAVHSYMKVPGGRTRYLSELKSGDSVLICGRDGESRKASVGRCKTERRPLLMITATDGRNDFSVMLQNAETVKMVTPEGSVSVTKLRPGDAVLAELSSGGRHFGMTVEETVSEK